MPKPKYHVKDYNGPSTEQAKEIFFSLKEAGENVELWVSDSENRPPLRLLTISDGRVELEKILQSHANAFELDTEYVEEFSSHDEICEISVLSNN